MSTGVGFADRLPRLTNPVLPAAEALTGMATSKAPKATNTADSHGRIRRFTFGPSHFTAEIYFRLPTPGGLGTPLAQWPEPRAISLLRARHGRKRRCAHPRGGLGLWQPVRSSPDQPYRDSGRVTDGPCTGPGCA